MSDEGLEAAAQSAYEDVMSLLEQVENLETENAKLRAELAALRGHWAHSNPGLADQYRAEAFACRRALGFTEDSQEVSPRELVDAIRAQPAIPEGFVLVPVEPTPGMIEAGRESLILGDFKKVKNNYERIYKAMLAAKENNHD